MGQTLVGEVNIFAFVQSPALIVSVAAESALASIWAEALSCAEMLAHLNLVFCSTCAGINIDEQAGDVLVQLCW